MPLPLPTTHDSHAKCHEAAVCQNMALGKQEKATNRFKDDDIRIRTEKYGNHRQSQ
jgi:hypothetical protein